jgi:hypothetical protein
MLRLAYLVFILACAGAVGLLLLFLRDPGETPRYVGGSSCSPCHDTRSAGTIHTRWAATPHADAYDALARDSAVEYLRAHDVTVDQCLPCHATLGRRGIDSIEMIAMREGVGCESCHGPGSAYLSATTMIDHSSFEHFGGNSGSLRDCYRCHADRLNGHDSLLMADRSCPFDDDSFSADSAWMQIDHTRSDSSGASRDRLTGP